MKGWIIAFGLICLILYWRRHRAIARRRRAQELHAHAGVSTMARGSPPSRHLQPFTPTQSIIQPPLPGEILLRDLRSDATKVIAAQVASSSPTSTSSGIRDDTKQSSIRVLNWNIERGFKLPQLIKELKAITPSPDVLLLQEIDIDCNRTNRADVAAEIAVALDMQYVFACDML
jgi:hypothetical protein